VEAFTSKLLACSITQRTAEAEESHKKISPHILKLMLRVTNFIYKAQCCSVKYELKNIHETQALKAVSKQT